MPRSPDSEPPSGSEPGDLTIYAGGQLALNRCVYLEKQFPGVQVPDLITCPAEGCGAVVVVTPLKSPVSRGWCPLGNWLRADNP